MANRKGLGKKSEMLIDLSDYWLLFLLNGGRM